MLEEMLDMVPCSGEEVVDAEHLAPRLQQSLAKMRAEKSGSAANQNASFEMLHYSLERQTTGPNIAE
jgi:hypothetical protein